MMKCLEQSCSANNGYRKQKRKGSLKDHLVKLITETRRAMEKRDPADPEQKKLKKVLFIRRLRLHELMLLEKSKKVH